MVYGVVEEEFEELTLEINEKGEITHTSEIVKSKVFEKIYLDLQEDETEFANEDFKVLYNHIIDDFNKNQDFKIDRLISKLSQQKAELITHILFDSEKDELHDWEGRKIYVTGKEETIAKYVSDTILNLRRYLIELKIIELSKSPSIEGSIDKQIMQNIFDYQNLQNLIAKRLNRVL